jgi:hypothetical protein
MDKNVLYISLLEIITVTEHVGGYVSQNAENHSLLILLH